MEVVLSTLDLIVERVIAWGADDQVAARYPNRARFIAADNPDHSTMAERGLAEGHPVVIVFPNGHELLIRPNGSEAPRIEARDESGLPIAA